MRKRYTQQELDEMYLLHQQGANYEEIARMFNRTTKGIALKFSEMGWAKRGKKFKALAESPTVSDTTNDVAPAVVAKPKRTPLDAYQPRELIKYLYNLGYRIEDNRLVYVHRQVISLKTVLED
jgi:hypothetical protein